MVKQISAVLLAALCAGCGDDGEGGAPPVRVVVEAVSVAGAQPPANPRTSAPTPSFLNRAHALVYQAEGVPDMRVKCVLVLMPGFLGGAGTFQYMGQRLVERSGGDVAVWAVDRRSNALEDQRGLTVAEAMAQPDLAKAYYFQGGKIEGEQFAGFLNSNTTNISYMSEWGIRTHVEDLDALIETAAERYPNAAIFLGGHSLGAAIAPIYAAWNFGEYAGFQRLSGLVLIEGRPAANTEAPIPSQDAYETTGIEGFFGSTSLMILRSGDPTVTLPFVGRDLFVAAQIVAMRASDRIGDPGAVSPDEDIFGGFFRLLFGLSRLPRMTNRAALAFGFDDDFQVLSFIRAAIGDTTGPTQPNTSPVAQIFGARTLVPSDPTTLYDWPRRFHQADPDPTDIDTLAEAIFAGPSDFVEWYFPGRLTLDVQMTANLNVRPSGDWRNVVYGMAVTENARVDVPVFAVGGAAGLVPRAEEFEPYRLSISPILRNGTNRTSSLGFVSMIFSQMAHIDPLTADDSGEGNGFFAPLLEWMRAAAQLMPRAR